MKKTMLTLILTVYASASYGLDCTRPIKNVWSGFDGHKVYVIHGDGFANSGMRLEYVNNDDAVINRTLSIIMSAGMASKSISFRYSGGDDGSAASCTPTVTQKLIGAWVSF